VYDDEEQIQTIKAKPYLRESTLESGGRWRVRIIELPGCTADGVTLEEALFALDDVMTEWLRVKLEDGHPIPEPMKN
jgi:predicted RNase H-like HicB family nuclease